MNTLAELEAYRISGIYASMVRLTDRELREIPANAEFHVRAAAADEIRRRQMLDR